jgi:hypothetical protein
VHPLGDEHHERQPDAEDREEQVEAERGADLAAAGGEMGDDGGRWSGHSYLLRNIAYTPTVYYN